MQRNLNGLLFVKCLSLLPSISERFDKLASDCQLNGFHLMLIVRDLAGEKSVQFVDNFLASKKEAKLDSYLLLQIDSKETRKSENAPIVQSLDWPSVDSGKVFLCTYDSKGREIGRLISNLTSTTRIEQINEFFVRHSPPTNDANKK